MTGGLEHHRACRPPGDRHTQPTGASDAAAHLPRHQGHRPPDPGRDPPWWRCRRPRRRHPPQPRRPPRPPRRTPGARRHGLDHAHAPRGVLGPALGAPPGHRRPRHRGPSRHLPWPPHRAVHGPGPNQPVRRLRPGPHPPLPGRPGHRALGRPRRPGPGPPPRPDPPPAQPTRLLRTPWPSCCRTCTPNGPLKPRRASQRGPSGSWINPDLPETSETTSKPRTPGWPRGRSGRLEAPPGSAPAPRTTGAATTGRCQCPPGSAAAR